MLQIDNNKGSIEITMNYSLSEDGKNDMIFLSVSRLRFTIQTMETHENYTGKTVTYTYFTIKNNIEK